MMLGRVCGNLRSIEKRAVPQKQAKNDNDKRLVRWIWYQISYLLAPQMNPI
jgi:hypothetical protein